MSGNGTLNTTILMVYNEMCNEISFDVFIIKLYTTLFDVVYKFMYFAKCKNRHGGAMTISMLCGACYIFSIFLF